VIVFCNTTPIIALASIDQLDLLPRLFGKIHVADAVINECTAGGLIRVPNLVDLDWVIPIDSAAWAMPHVLLELDHGEKVTLALASQMKADRVIIDEKLGRSLAEYLGLAVTGTLGVLLKARQQALVPSFRKAAQAMRRQGIYYSPALIERLARTVGE